jgi:predicted transcriptional regulator
MGKQLSIYLPDEVMKRLNEVANKQCRRPHDQARYILLSSLGIAVDDQSTTDHTATKLTLLPTGSNTMSEQA